MKNLNLLPHKIEQQKKSRKAKIRMIFIQVAIILCIGASVLFLRAIEQNILSRSYVLAQHLAAINEDPLLLAIELENARATARYLDQFFLDNIPVEFEAVWVETILLALPGNVNIIQLNYNRSQIIILGEVEDIIDVGIYIQNLIDSEVFVYVDMGNIVLLENGLFSYELRIQVSRNEN